MTAPIKVDISELLANPGTEKRFDALIRMEPLHRGEEEFPFKTHVEVDVRIESPKRGMLLVDGDASGMLGLVCSRCAEPFDHIMGVLLNETYCVPLRMQEDEECRAVEGHEIDLGPAVEQAFLLSLPMKILHDEDCKGLCPTCGVNLNIELEHEHEAAVNPDFAVLERLLGGEWEQEKKEE
ncbi:MAG: DUF177 domain-containing protein [Actinobacteria bacterium]|nr:MAG: DUF177 domain-containing protein [Actinomycetota bacterium]